MSPKFWIIGQVYKTPEPKKGKNGKKYTTLRVKCIHYNQKSQEWSKDSFRFSLFDEVANYVNTSINLGDTVLVEGIIKNIKYIKEGVPVHTINFIVNGVFKIYLKDLS